MDKIKIMSENLANKIAAGEVVEKCASIVKELVENSIDAQAEVIKIDLIDGGLQGITVTDNGVGMSPNDAVLAFQRHATSKLLKEDDLFFIDTLGFRGEALPSIASVSEVTLTTSQGEEGTKIHIKGGQLLEQELSDARVGTKIEVKNLFYNTPARLKYLKSEQSELAYCTSFIERLALSKPNIQFTMTNNGRTIIKTSGSNNLLKTIHEIFGLNVSSKMLELHCANDDYEINGYICKPEVLKSSRNYMITIVNNRVVKNNDLNRAINDAYYTYKPETKYPLVVLNIETDPTLIDVNIHPTKQDIKLSKVGDLTKLLINSIKDLLYQNLLIPNALKEPLNNPIKEEIISNIFQTKDTDNNNLDYKEDIQTTFDLSINESPTKEEIIINPEIKKLQLYPVGLALGTYIIAQNENGIYIIDQHAAQERINYEKYLKALKDKNVTTIAPLFPITIELSASDFITLKEHLADLTNIGFNLQEFGVNTYVVKSHPTWLKEGYEEESIRRIFDLVINSDRKFDPVKFNENIAITLACKMSIKANMHISHEAQEELLNQLTQTDNPYNCPHGRPTIIKFSIYDLEKMFKRVMN